MVVATGLVSSLFNVASSRDVPFCQPQYIQCMHHGLTFVLLYVPLLFTDNPRCWFTIPRYGFPQAVHAFHLYWVYSSFLYYSSFVTLCDGQSIAKMKCNGPPHLQLVIDYWDEDSDAKLLFMYTTCQKATLVVVPLDIWHNVWLTELQKCTVIKRAKKDFSNL